MNDEVAGPQEFLWALKVIYFISENKRYNMKIIMKRRLGAA